MRVNRGCGCLLLVLAAINLVFFISGLYGLASGNVEVGLGMLAIVLFGANLVAALLLGLAGIRRQRIGAGETGGEVIVEAGEGGPEEGEIADEEGGE